MFLPTSSTICIIGAGPSGATASMFLSKMGIPHLLLDAATFPRDKICGDGLDLNTIRVLNQFDKGLMEQLMADKERYQVMEGVRIVGGNGKVNEAFYKGGRPEEPMYLTGRRKDFDSFLHQQLDHKFANVQLGAKVTNIVRQEDGILLTVEKDGHSQEVFTRLVIGADGDHSVVLRKLDERKIDRSHYAAALRIYYKGIQGMGDKNMLEVYFPKQLPWGYFWIFPMSNGEMNVGLGMQSHQISKHKVNLREVFEELITKDPNYAQRFAGAEALETPQGWGLPLASRGRKNFGDNYLLAGDAGSLIHPLSGEGIGSAMISGFVAAHYARRAVETNKFDADSMKHYQVESVRRMYRDINIYKVFNAIGSARLQNFSINMLVNSGIAGHIFQYCAPQWSNTAYHKPIEVKFG